MTRRCAYAHFRNIMGDTTTGVLSDDEQRTKLKQVNADAAIAPAPVRAAATEMPAGITTGTGNDLLNAVGKMDSSCKSAGH